jgi:PKD repeat protein
MDNYLGGAYRLVNADGTTSAGCLPPNAAPVAKIVHKCSGTWCQFDGSGSSDPDGSIVSYSWVLGDGYTNSGPKITHTYPNNDGTYLVQLTVTDNRGGKASASRTIRCVKKGNNIRCG